jgi:hypothetical protein
VKRYRFRGATTLLAFLIFAAPVPAQAAAATTDAVLQWNEYATTALIGNVAPYVLQPPPVAVLHLAMVHGAVYDAVNAIDGDYQPYLGAPKSKHWYSSDAAAATAAYWVLVDPTLRIPAAQLAPLAGYYAASLGAISNGAAKDGGIAVGKAAADKMLAARANDGRFGTFRFTVPASPAPGQWRPTATPPVNDPNAWVARVTPFMIDTPSRFKSNGPNALTSGQYATEFNEVKALGALTGSTRTTDQTNAANFWAQQPAATWSTTFRSLASGHGLSTAQNARLFAMLYLTAADALIACWDDKARWLFWRPITAIHEADNDGNPGTSADPTWTSLIPTPPYPDQPSGHACFSGSITSTLKDFFGTDNMALTVVRNDGSSRSFTRFSGAIDEIIEARIWSGLHFRIADVDGAKIGKQVAEWRDDRFFQRCDRGEEDRGSGEDRHDGEHGDGDGHDGHGCAIR